MKYEIELMRRAATIAGHTKCWIGIGCVIAKNGNILVEAWNETLKGEEYCQTFRDAHRGRSSESEDRPQNNAGCVRHDLGLSQGKEIEKACSIHAEANAIALAARKGISVRGATLFVTSFPCLICLRTIIASGIKKIVYMNDFYKPHSLEMLKKNRVKIEQITEEEVWRKKG